MVSSDEELRARAEAETAVHARLALVSAAVWMLGVAALLVASAWVGDGAVMADAVVLLAPAGLFWLARSRLIGNRVARAAEAEYERLGQAAKERAGEASGERSGRRRRGRRSVAPIDGGGGAA